MDFGITEEQKRFIDELTDFCATTPRGEIAGNDEVPDDAAGNFSFSFYQKVCDRGWAGITFPREYGGLGLGNTHQIIFNETMQSLGAPISVTTVSNNNWLGGLIVKYGTEAQKKEHLPPIVSGEVVTLCQSFTEPDAGADLANVKTRAILDGEDYVINGQKMFSSNAHLNGDSTRLIILVRTDPDATPEKGISLFYIRPDLPGITVRPLWTDGGGRTNELFFDNVRVPRQALIGEESGLNKGWPQFRDFEWGDWERGAGCYPVVFGQVLSFLIDIAKKTEMDGRLLSQDPAVRRNVAELSTEIDLLRLLSHKMVWAQDNGEDALGAAAIASNVRDAMAVRFSNLALSILGPYGQLQKGSKHAVLDGLLEGLYRMNTFSLFGLVGPLTRKNFIAHHVMDLPTYHGY